MADSNNETIQRFYVTFGQKSPLRKGYVEVIVRGDMDEKMASIEAHEAAMDLFGDKWSNVYPHNDFVKSLELFPGGKFGETIEVSA